jgi:hypothetical protein
MTPSIHTLIDVIGETENRAIHADHPCDAGRFGKAIAEIRQTRNKIRSAAEIPHPKATIFSGLFDCAFMTPSGYVLRVKH